MDKKQFVKISKYLSLHLRHHPEQLGLTLQPGGWVEVATLLDACARKGFPITLEQLHQVIENNDKQRFSLNETGTLIRANQGHSIEIDLQLEPCIPPAVLYHGTGERTKSPILRDGLLKMNRHHVHLSIAVETAKTVGARHGKPIVFEVDAARMHQDGFVFFCSTNGVWLVDRVPATYLRQL